jgi:quinol monooxygenase YgiN
MHFKRRMLAGTGIAALLFAAGWFAAGARAQQSPLKVPANPSPYYVINFVDIVPEHAAAGTRAVRNYVIATRKEPGVISIIALAQINRPNHLVVYEVWRNRAAYDKHVAGKTSIDFRTTMQPFLGAPFDQRPQWRIE